MNPIILAGSGPSLSTVPWDQLPYPCAAINRAALMPDRKPDYWFMVDGRMETLLAEPAKERMQDQSIAKVLPAYKRDSRGMGWLASNGRNLCWIDVHHQQHQDRNAQDRGRRPFDGSLPLFKLRGLTFTFALQFLTALYSDVILVGCDLEFEGRAIHFDGKQQTASAMSHERKSLEDALLCVKAWWPHVQQRGRRWWRIGPGRLVGVLPEWPPLASDQPSV